MTLPKAFLDRVNTTSLAQLHRIELVLAKAAVIAGDNDRAARLQAQLCKSCFYTHHFAGQAFTAWTCGLCGATAQHHNTAVPQLCGACATKYDLCSNCGADIDLRPRFRRTAPKAKVTK